MVGWLFCIHIQDLQFVKLCHRQSAKNTVCSWNTLLP